ncbi:hypothetical protein Ancab_023113 [Ancistrocladus abbreviatus]
MGRSPCYSKEGLNRGAWTALEDRMLTAYISAHGEGNWRSLPERAGVKRSGKSCRLRWLNYLRPDIKRGNISVDEEDLIIRLHKLLGNRWSLIAGRLPGRTDNEIKNYWNTTLAKKLGAQTPPMKRKTKSKARPKASNGEPRRPKASSADATASQQQNQVIPTKASRCTKVIVDALPPQNLQHITQFIEVPNPQSRNTSNNNVVSYFGNQEDGFNSGSSLMNSNNYFHFQQFNEPTGEDWLGNSNCLGESATLGFSIGEWLEELYFNF